MVSIKLFKVGGCIRDELLGLKPKDIDYTVVIESVEPISAAKGFDIVESFLRENDYTIFLKSPDTFTFRAKTATGEVADFVLARHELGYDETSRTPHSVLGTLEQDLIRRDFTINAMARDEAGNLIDLFGGHHDLAHQILRTPLDPVETMMDDPLRLFRALRFSITKDLSLDPALWTAFSNPHLYEKLWRVVSRERIREELHKMFAADSVRSMKCLVEFGERVQPVAPNFLTNLFTTAGIWLKPTTEKIR